MIDIKRFFVSNKEYFIVYNSCLLGGDMFSEFVKSPVLIGEKDHLFETESD